MSDTNTFELEHIVRPSSLKANAPLIIMLHGFGSDENDLFSFSSELDPEYFIISLKAPHTMFPYGNAWYSIHFDAPQGKWTDTEEALASRDKIARFIDQAIKHYPVDPDKVTLLGFSQGTILSIAVALTYPDKIKNIVALSGYVNIDLIPPEYQSNDYSRLSFYCSHGSADQVIPVDWARKTPPFFKSLGIDFSYEEFPVGHGVAPQNFYSFRNWLQERK
ncbi:MAG: alpha/beta fold hydrolase [Flavobacteriaceae bacterium]|nr:alpha/beta fold hydrolase [Bacteroidia bacterium]NNF75387.1 alpha/beta fold hydrolase [Flavobacteriaceae bacterium]NNK72463.1 alpha/beta fold hydrolase [Flavobacteriaceae bacterium]